MADKVEIRHENGELVQAQAPVIIFSMSYRPAITFIAWLAYALFSSKASTHLRLA